MKAKWRGTRDISLLCDECGATSHVPMVLVTVVADALYDDTYLHWVCVLCRYQHEVPIPSALGANLLDNGASLALAQ